MNTKTLARIFAGCVATVVLVLIPVSAHAATATFYGPIVPPECQCDTSAPSYGCVLATVQNVINLMVSLGCIFAVLALVYAGFTWMMNGSNPEARSKGRTMILNVFIGLAILLSAWLIVDFIMKKLYVPTAADGTAGSSTFGPWNSILGANPGDMCIAVSTPHQISGLLGGLATGVLGGSSSDGSIPGSQDAAGGSGGGANCPAADPSTMVAIPANLVQGGTGVATPTTVQNFIAMHAAALQAGFDLRVTSAYRSDASQLQQYNAVGGNTALAARPCSLGGPGSNHESGTALDLTDGCTRNVPGCNTGAYNWLKAHGGQWGFYNNLPLDQIHWSPSGH